jgi:hypothetical protein
LKEWNRNPTKLEFEEIKHPIERQKWAEAIARTKDLEDEPASDWLDPKKFAPFSRFTICEHRRDIFGFYQQARQIAGLHERDASILNLVAWKIVDPHSRIPRRDWSLAAALARQAVRLAPNKPGYRDTLAWALYGEKHTSEAIKSEGVALQSCEDADELERCRAALSLFRKFPR